MSESVIFNAAVKLPPEERSDYLQRACGNDAQLRGKVESLLVGHDQALDFLEQPAIALAGDAIATSNYQPVSEGPGTVIGPYKLMEQIGEGAFGLVFVAEQQQPVRRKVALKVIKPGMDTKEVVARFEAERQALALMDHPNIAKVFDAGTTESGRPYFVMELVRGVPIVEYCDAHQLSTEERLRLFVTVCHAVQHAHAKGVIHRDLKPSNILIAPHDGIPVVKVIDFGIAKAIGQQLSEKTIYTSFAQMIGTPLYMSPEQAEVNALDVDTRSDVYSLGVLLYELLTGTTPFDRERMSSAAFDEIRRIIREEEPIRPSTRLSTLGDTLPLVSRQRKSDPGKLPSAVRGDLDWIVMKSLEKNRDRRYETANGLAMDVERHLSNEPVVARPPSAAYRFRKLIKRNGRAVFATTTIAAGIPTGLLLYGLVAHLSSDKGDFLTTIVAPFESEKLDDEFAISTELKNADNKIAREFQRNPVGEAELRSKFADKLKTIGWKQRPEQSSVLWGGAKRNLKLSFDAYRQELGALNESTLKQLAALESLLEFSGDVNRQVEVRRMKLDLFEKEYGADDDRTLGACIDLAWSLNWQGEFSEAETLRKRVYDSKLRLNGEEHSGTLNALANWADALHAAGDEGQARVQRQRYLDIVQDDTDLVSRSSLAMAFVAQGDLARASQLYDKSVSTDDLGIEYWLDGQNRVLNAETPMLLLRWEHWCPWSQQFVHRMNRVVIGRNIEELQVLGLTKDTENHHAEYFIERNKPDFHTAKFNAKLIDDMNGRRVPFLFAVHDGQVVWTGQMWQLSRAFVDGLAAATSADSEADK